MIRLYDILSANRRRKRARWLAVFALAFWLLAMGACVYLCTRVYTGNEKELFLRVLVLSVLSGWAAIGAFALYVVPQKRMYRHEINVLNVEKTEREGEIRLLREEIRIPKSVCVYTVLLKSDGQEARYSVRRDRARKLPKDGDFARLICAGRFVFAVREAEDE